MEIKTLEGIDIEKITNVFNQKLLTTVISACMDI